MRSAGLGWKWDGLSDYTLTLGVITFSDYTLTLGMITLTDTRTLNDYTLTLSDYTLTLSDYTLTLSDYTLTVSDYTLTVSDYTLKIGMITFTDTLTPLVASQDGGRLVRRGRLAGMEVGWAQ